MPLSASNLAVGSSIKWPCSMHFDAGGDRLPDRTRRIRMYGHIGAPIFGSLNRGTNLRFGVLGRFDRIVEASDAAAAPSA